MHLLSEKVKKHESSMTHMDSCLKFSMFGRVNIASQLDKSYRLVLCRHNDEVSKKTVTLLNILITTSRKTGEAERCFSTLKRIKTFLRNAMGQERLNALAMLSMEREFDRTCLISMRESLITLLL